LRGEVKGYLNEAELNHVKALYAGEVTMMDKWVGTFLKRVRDIGLLDRTMVIFLSDHGIPLGEHGIIRKARPWPYEELIRIPLIMRHPEGIGKGKRIKALVETPDVMPTILDFLGIKIPETVHGSSLLPLISEEKEKIRDYAYSGFFNRSWSIRDEEWKYIHWLPGPPSHPTKPELYNLKKDHEELSNLVDQESKTAKALELNLKNFVENLKAKD